MRCVDDFLEFGMGTSLRQFGYWKRKGNREWTRTPDEKWAAEQYEIGEMN